LRHLYKKSKHPNKMPKNAQRVCPSKQTTELSSVCGLCGRAFLRGTDFSDKARAEKRRTRIMVLHCVKEHNMTKKEAYEYYHDESNDYYVSVDLYPEGRRCPNMYNYTPPDEVV